MPLLGNRVRLIREKRGWTQAELAARANISPTYISGVERGEIYNPHLEMVVRIADALRVPVDYLTREEVVTPFEVLDHIPDDMVQWLLSRDVVPYLQLAREAQAKGIPPQAMAKLQELIQLHMKGLAPKPQDPKARQRS